MVIHMLNVEKCRGCGKCIEICGMELWELIDWEDGTKKARAVEEAPEICNGCKCCQDACPEDAIEIRVE